MAGDNNDGPRADGATHIECVSLVPGATPEDVSRNLRRLEVLIDGMENLGFYALSDTEEKRRNPNRYWLVDTSYADPEVGYPGHCIGNENGYLTRAEIVTAKATEILRRLDGIA